jgi:pantetheine-phosphate adenylyltransferase
MNKKTAVYPGAFDPITYGHIDVIKRALKIFDRLIIAVVEKPKKGLLFTAEERIGMVRAAINNLNIRNVDVESFDTLLVDYLKNKKIDFVVRGLRAVSDFDREFQMAVSNKDMDSNIETIFIMTDKKYFYLNSTLVKEVARYGGPLGGLVTKDVEKKLREKFVE